MPKRATTDTGRSSISRAPPAVPGGAQGRSSAIRLASREDVTADEVRVGWPAYFRPFIDRRLVFVYDETGGQAVTAPRRMPCRPRSGWAGRRGFCFGDLAGPRRRLGEP